jgi:hypothetical protein
MAGILASDRAAYSLSWGWAMAIVTPAATSGLPNAPTTCCAIFQWHQKDLMMDIEVVDRTRSHFTHIAALYKAIMSPS